MNSNELKEYVRELNKQEAAQTELRRQAALKKIRELRQRNKYKEQEGSTNGKVIFK